MITNKMIALKSKIGFLDLVTPRGGRCRIFGVDNQYIHYIQGKTSVYTYDLNVFYETYNYFKGSRCSTNDLKKYNPDVYMTNDKGGHDCNCMVFMLLIQYFFGKKINGSGHRGNPYNIFY